MEQNTPFYYAFLYISALIGAGFATGKELYFYFFRRGMASGVSGVFLSALLFALCAYKTLRLTAVYGIKNYSGLLELLFGKALGKVFYLTSICFFLVLFAAMSASFGEIVCSLGIPKAAGSLSFCIFCHITAKSFKKGANGINSLLCPVILLGCPLLALSEIKGIRLALPSPAVMMSSVIYTAYNLLTSTAVLCGCEKADRKTAVQTALIIFFCIFISGSLAGLLSTVSAALPIYTNIRHSPLKCGIYMLVLLCAVFTTAMGNLSCIPKRLPYPAAMGFLISLCGFGRIVERIYYILFFIPKKGITALPQLSHHLQSLYL